MSSDDERALAPALPLLPPWSLMTSVISKFHRNWPVAVVSFALLVNVAWIGLLGFGLFKLVEPLLFWSIS